MISRAAFGLGETGHIDVRALLKSCARKHNGFELQGLLLVGPPPSKSNSVAFHISDRCGHPPEASRLTAPSHTPIWLTKPAVLPTFWGVLLVLAEP